MSASRKRRRRQAPQSRAEPTAPRTARHRLELAVFLALVAFTYLSMTRGLTDGNTWARMGFVFAAVERGEMNIDPVVAANLSHDWSRHGGHYYSNKAPGPGLLVLPFYFVQYEAERLLGVSPDAPAARDTAAYVGNLVASVIPTLIALGLLWEVLVRRWRLSEASAFALCGTLAVGSLALPYSVLFFAHQSAGAFVAIGACLTLLEMDRPGPPRRARVALAGLAMGMAAISDYMSAALVILWTIFLVWADRRMLLPWVIGGAGPAIAVAIYQRACFGAFFTLPYNTDVLNPLFGKGGNWVMPSLDRFLDVTVRPWRGLFYCTPVFAMVFVGFDRLREEARRHPEMIPAAAGVIVYCVTLASYRWAFAGWCLGPRFFTSALPLAIFLMVPAVRLLPRLFGFLASLSFLLMLAGTIVDPIIDERLKDPFSQFVFPVLAKGGPAAMRNVFTSLLGMDLRAAMAVYVVIWAAGALWLRSRLRRSSAPAA